jgi:chromosome segregation protein
VFLKSLTLKGFKSFADTTTLEFEPGVTVVVGPNGSGKSNVVDAVAWVLGAQGPRTVRSAKMEDVIFAGTPSRPALGRAEVSLTIDNSAGLLPIDFSEVTITRTLFRTGESEYAINRVPCRLLDIQELLSDTGVGRQQHVIVSQGNLDAILNARPEERRLVIEEAAGVLKFRRRKEKAERRLESTEASLVRLQDLLREVRRQLRPLERQAEAARRHGGLVAELTAVRRHLLAGELGSVEARLGAARRDRAEVGRAETGVRQALTRLDADILAAEAEDEAARTVERTADLSEAVSRAEGLRARAGGLLAVLEERRRSVDRERTSALDFDVIAGLEAEAIALTDRLAGADDEATRLLPAADELAAAEEGLAEEAASVESRWRREGPIEGNPAAQARAELAALGSALERSAAENRRLEAGRHTIDQRMARLSAETARLTAVVEAADRRSSELADQEQATREAEAMAATRTEVSESECRAADAELHRWTAREEALAQALDQARARAGAERLAEVGGVVGTLLELVQVDAGYEAAFEAGVGEGLSAVVVDGVEAARRGLGELRRGRSEGAVVALPDVGSLSEAAEWVAAPVRAVAGLDPPRDAPAITGPLRPHVQAWLPNVAVLLDRLLANVVVVDGDWEGGLDAALAHPELIVVTRAGDRFAGGVWRTGCGPSGTTTAAVEEAQHRAAAARLRVTEADTKLAEVRQAAVQARAQHATAVRDREAYTSRCRAAEDAIRRMETELSESASELRAVEAQREEVAARIDRDQVRIGELEALLPALEREAAAEAERAAAERTARSRLAERTAQVASMRRDLEVRAAGLEERQALTARRLQEVEERLRRHQVEREHAADRRRHLEQAAALAARLTGLLADQQGGIEGALERLRAARHAETEAARIRTERLEQLRRQRATAEHQLSELRERSARIDLDETESRVRMEGTVEAIRRDLECEPDAVRGAECPDLPPGTSATSRRSELERELRVMGPVNPLALEEHRALEERHEFLAAQLEDVRSARRELAKVIRAVDSEIVDVFRAAFADVADHFENLFTTLFPGGQGRLRLTDPDHLLETGIEVEARPSGKNIRRLSLLSGGERSLTAMAFLFAVFRSRPSPFYMLDEVEAALDDVNLHRFLDLVHEFRSEAQLLVVSHQKRTMEAADCLYGVTMAPGGSSRVISERVAASASS